MGKPPGGGSGEGIVSLGVHVLSTEMGSANHARGLRTQITGAMWRISGRVQVGVLSTMCHRAGEGGVLEGRVGECSGKEGCRVPVCTHVQEFSQQPRVGCGALLSVCCCGSVCMLLWVLSQYS